MVFEVIVNVCDEDRKSNAVEEFSEVALRIVGVLTYGFRDLSICTGRSVRRRRHPDDPIVKGARLEENHPLNRSSFHEKSQVWFSGVHADIGGGYRTWFDDVDLRMLKDSEEHSA
ncbi:DUF2235 domain-containing protein [Nitrobacter sp. 62-13]|uniref:DUF2235 domain-containing protein n=1 Tax=Nitrobacter sp. 62-13 TaxID=1895797 RepID=UPI0025D4BFCF|nr:DUF2235 domain-containing protein [Nitrobacter sp. 62-13]